MITHSILNDNSVFEKSKNKVCFYDKIIFSIGVFCVLVFIFTTLAVYYNMLTMLHEEKLEDNLVILSETPDIQKHPDIELFDNSIATIYERNLDYPLYNDFEDLGNDSIIAAAQALYGECNNCSITQKAGVMWIILNRVDDNRFPNTIIGVVSATNADGTIKQFDGYSPNYPVTEENLNVVLDVIHRWQLEKTALGSVGRVLPSNYFFFRSNGKGENVFRQEYNSKTTWNWEWGTIYP